MFDQLPVQRLSPKHQVTLLKGARGLAGADEQGQVCVLPHRMANDAGESFPVLVMLTEAELRERERRIREDDGLQPFEKERLIARLNGHVRVLTIDAQRRVVLPPHFVDYLEVEREVFMFSNNDSVLVWNPADWLAYAGTEGPEDSPSPLLMI